MNFLAILSNLAGPDLIIILLIVLVLFGAKKLPELARGMGQAMKEFQKAKDDFTDELHQAPKPTVATANPVPTTPRLEQPLPPPVSAPLPQDRPARTDADV